MLLMSAFRPTVVACAAAGALTLNYRLTQHPLNKLVAVRMLEVAQKTSHAMWPWDMSGRRGLLLSMFPCYVVLATLLKRRHSHSFLPFPHPSLPPNG